MNYSGFFLVGSLFLLSLCGCDSKQNNENLPQEYQSAEPYPRPYERPVPQSQYPSSSSTTENNEEASKPEATVVTTPSPVIQTTVSRYYQEGYDKGYDDGEDDAVSGNGWGGQFDDECRYKGEKLRDYQQGYEEGYEAGYDDNYMGADD